MDKNKQMITYLMSCPKIANSPLYFQFSNPTNKTNCLATNDDDIALQSAYIDGSVLKRYTFTINSFIEMTDLAIASIQSKTNPNVNDMYDTQGLIDWVSQQNEIRNFPNFGEKCEIESIQALTEAPTFAGIYNTSQNPPLAKYTTTIRVEYIDTTKTIF